VSLSFILVHSPLVGPSCWKRTGDWLAGQDHAVQLPSALGFETQSPPYWERCLDRLVEEIESQADPCFLVGHSGAGLLLPELARRLATQISGFIFVDASLPPSAGRAPTAEPDFLTFLMERANGDRVPPWSSWFGPDAMARLVPDQRARKQAVAEMPRLPLGYFRESFPVPIGWDSTPCAYLQFSDIYQDRAEDARSRGWTVARLDGRHLHMLVDPNAVATALVDLALRLGAAAS
jgi:pimeloyl-ACP methyl ester carboxylesterase